MKNNCRNLLINIGHIISPQRTVEYGEDDLHESYDASYNKFPENIVFAETIEQIHEEIEFSTKRQYDKIKIRRRYLWVISENKINIAYEATPSKAARGCICHTNVTGNENAIIGGELWFLKEKNTYSVHINFFSGRYPITKQTQLTNKPVEQIVTEVIQLFNCVGYKNVKLLK